MQKVEDIASLILARSGRPFVDAMALQKLLYYVQAWHLAITDEPLFRESFKAWRDGPVVPQVWHERSERSSRRAGSQRLDGIHIDAVASNIIDWVLESYGGMSGEELSALTHVEEPWLEARGDLPPDAPCSEAIDYNTVRRFYRTQRTLGRHTAADLAAGGFPSGTNTNEEIDIDAILAEYGGFDDAPDDDPWGGANLHHSERLAPRRAQLIT